jgi:hypothetical protein
MIPIKYSKPLLYLVILVYSVSCEEINRKTTQDHDASQSMSDLSLTFDMQLESSLDQLPSDDLDRSSKIINDAQMTDLTVDLVDALSRLDSQVNPIDIDYIPDGNPINPQQGVYPYPSNFFLQANANTVTGWRINLPPQFALYGISSEYLAQQDGFSRMPMILSQWPNGVDPSSLGSIQDPAQSILNTSITLLIEQGTLKRIPHLAEVDVSANDPALAPLIIRPLEVLQPNQNYIVLIQQGLQDIEGQAHVAPLAFQVLRDDIPTEIEEIERQRDEYRLIFDELERADFDINRSLLAWSFHTRSRQNSIDPLLKMQEIAAEWPLGDWSITSDRLDGVNRQIEGVFEVPLFVGDHGIVYDDFALPTVIDTAFYPFTFTLPTTLAGEPRPVIVYGHGFLGNRIQATRSSFNDLCVRGRYSALGLNFGFHEEILLLAVQSLTGDTLALDKLIAEVMQTMVNTTTLVRFAREKFASDFIEINTAEVHYMGISNGGTFGYLFAATTAVIEKAILVVGGGGLSHFLQRATQWNELGFIATSRYSSPADLQFFLSILQSLLDPIDPINFVDHLVAPRFNDLPPIKVQVHMAVNDSQVHNLVSEWMVRSAGIPLMMPSVKPIWGLFEWEGNYTQTPAEDYPLGALFVYDEHVTPSPLGNIPPTEDNGTHGTVRQLDVYQEHIIDFISTGLFRQQCDGVCDPE